MILFVSLFGAAFLAATILPFSSEAALSGALLGGLSPFYCLSAAVAGNSLGSISTYWLGRCGKLDWLRKYCRTTPQEIQTMQKRIGRWGGVAAFLCFLPVVGDVAAIALGYMRYSGMKFAVFMTVGKIIRYIIWLAIHQQLFA